MADTLIFTDLMPDDAAFASLGGFFQNWGYGAFTETDFASQFSHPSFGAVTAGTAPLLGALLYRITSDEAEIIEIAVDGAHRGKTIARQMIDYAKQQLAAKGVERLVLEVAENNDAAMRLYDLCRFTAVGRRAGYYQKQGQKIDAIIMELWLSKV